MFLVFHRQGIFLMKRLVMKYVLAGRTYEIKDLDPTLDAMFAQLHAAYLGPTPLPWDQFKAVAAAFLAGSPPRSSQHNDYFDNFTIIWNQLLSNGRYDDAEMLWQMALAPALETERQNPDHEIHKGTAYYFWAITAILRGDIDKGYALMHQAVEEDIATTGQHFSDTPAYALATLNWGKQDQAFRQWVMAQAQFLNDKQTHYSRLYGRSFTLEDFRQRFLASYPNNEQVFLFVYTIARLMRLGSVPEYTVQSRFAGQLFMNILFDILLTIEAALRAKNPAANSFIDHAEYLSQRAGIPITNAKLRELNQSFNADFDSTILSLLDGNFVFSDGSTLTRMQSDIAIAYGMRNRAAHDLTPTPVMWQRFHEIMQVLLNVLFMTIDFTYP
jgi:hypothetical protein